MYSQNTENNIFIGVNTGGPVPDYIADSSNARLKPGFNAGFEKIFKRNKKISWGIKTSYDYNNLEYSQTIKNDTLIPLPMDESIKVPTYYTADIIGRMNLHNAGIGIFINYNPWEKLDVMLGGYGRFQFAGSDKGDVNVRIGEGGFFDDYIDNYDNTSNIRKTDFALLVGMDFKVINKIKLGINLTRSLTTFYKHDINSYDNRNIKMFGTYVSFRIIYITGTKNNKK